MKMFLLIAALMLCGCSALERSGVSIGGDAFPKRDVQLEFEGQRFTGVAVLPARDAYTITMEFPGELNLFTFGDCHMDHSEEDAGSGEWLRKKNKITYKYAPRFPKEGEYCPVIIGGYEASTEARNAWGFIDFESRKETLPAHLECNGGVIEANGVSVCQAKAGLWQRVTFPVEVDISPDEACPMAKSDDSKTFKFKIAKGFCVYAFVSKDGKQRHRLSTLGYDKILIRKVSI